MASSQYDVIIVGAGPAGLSVGSELASDLRVLLIDKKTAVSQTQRSWFLPKRVVTDGDAQDILPYTYGGVKRFSTETFTGASVIWDANYDYIYVDEHKLLHYWGDLIKQRGGEIRLDCFYRDSHVYDDRVVVNTSDGEFSAKLLIDASGYNSPIRREYAEPLKTYWWSVSGCIAELPEGLGDMRVGDYMMWGTFADTNADINASMEDGRPILEYEILDDKTCFIFIFYLRPNRMEADEMKAEFLHVLRKEDATRPFHNAEVKEWKHGWYPSGGIHSQQVAEERVAFIGDAGCWTSPCGWGMSYITANYKQYAANLKEAVKNDHLSKHQLQSLIKLKLHTRYQVLLDQVVTHFLSYASANMLDQFIRLFEPGGPMEDKGPLLCEKLFTLTLSDDDVKYLVKHLAGFMDLKTLIRSMHPADYLLVLELMAEHLEKNVVDELHELFHRHHNKPEPQPKDGIELDDPKSSLWTRLCTFFYNLWHNVSQKLAPQGAGSKTE